MFLHDFYNKHSDLAVSKRLKISKSTSKAKINF